MEMKQLMEMKYNAQAKLLTMKHFAFACSVNLEVGSCVDIYVNPPRSYGAIGPQLGVLD